MKLLLVCSGYPPEHSGSGRRLHETYCRLQAHHPELSWRVVARSLDPALPSPPGPESIFRFASVLPSVGPALPLTWSAERLLALRHAARLLKGVDILHLAGFSWFAAALQQAAQARSIPVVRELTCRADGGSASGLGGWVMSRALRAMNQRAHLLVAISPALEQAVRQSGVTTPVWVRPNPVDIRRFHQPSPEERLAARKALSKELPCLATADADRITVIFHLGRIRPLKNQLLLVQALALLPESTCLVLAGPSMPQDAAYLADIRAAIRDLGLAHRVALLDRYIESPESLFFAADIFAFPSDHEGLGNVMLEALCCGLPVVASHLPGVTDWIITPGRNGALCERSPHALGTALSTIRTNSRDREGIARESRARFGAQQLDTAFYSHLQQRIHSPSQT